MVSVGIDLGSVATKAVVYNGDLISSAVVPTGWSPKQAGETIYHIVLTMANLRPEDVKCVVATGYGRVSLPLANRTVTEITCHAKGAHLLFPGVRTVLDIGGQDSKVICLDARGNVQNFIMNDKCAAGTGRFLQVMAGVLETEISELGKLAAHGKPVAITSMCTVFAESEVISLLAQGAGKEDVAAGLLHSVADRAVALTGKAAVGKEIAFTGGLAKNSVLVEILSAKMKLPVRTSPLSQLAGALGAAVIGWEA